MAAPSPEPAVFQRYARLSKPDELATTFVLLQREKRVDGLFLSSGIVPDGRLLACRGEV
jgi:predicted DNA-binding helix-hairpin-helix protein